MNKYTDREPHRYQLSATHNLMLLRLSLVETTKAQTQNDSLSLICDWLFNHQKGSGEKDESKQTVDITNRKNICIYSKYV